MSEIQKASALVTGSHNTPSGTIINVLNAEFALCSVLKGASVKDQTVISLPICFTAKDVVFVPTSAGLRLYLCMRKFKYVS